MTTETTEVHETVTFYSWAGSNNPTTGALAYPSSTAVNISGGVAKLANDGSKVRSVNKVAQFNHGVCQTDDPEIIAALRKLARTTNSGFTEDREEYYAHVMTTAEKAKRATLLNQQQAADNEKLREENRRLTAQLEEKGRETPTRRRQEA
jgi:multidrug efflux pump subunit AcrA (membrane-fusion protein)